MLFVLTDISFSDIYQHASEASSQRRRPRLHSGTDSDPYVAHRFGWVGFTGVDPAENQMQTGTVWELIDKAHKLPGLRQSGTGSRVQGSVEADFGCWNMKGQRIKTSCSDVSVSSDVLKLVNETFS